MDINLKKKKKYDDFERIKWFLKYFLSPSDVCLETI